MLEEMGKSIDACTISTPDHTHYPATMAAMTQMAAIERAMLTAMM